LIMLEICLSSKDAARLPILLHKSL
jgi:hypothetical protein